MIHRLPAVLLLHDRLDQLYEQVFQSCFVAGDFDL
jgi:hypothetical protein